MSTNDLTGPRPLRIVLADDDATILDALRELLEEAGYRVVATATDGLAAVAAVAEHHPDLLIADMRMPGLTGLEVATLLREKQPQLPVIILSAYDDAGLQIAAERVPVAAYLVKGASSQTIFRAIKQAVTSRSGRDSGRSDDDHRDALQHRADRHDLLPRAPLTVMCVEDDPDILQLLHMAIDLEPDFELVATTTDASEVLELVRTHRPGALILDHVLRAPPPAKPGNDPDPCPGLESGLDLIAAARAIVPNAIIVMFTGWESIQHDALDAGADLYIAKPFLDALWPAIRGLRPGT